MEQSYLFDLIRSLSPEEMAQVLEFAGLSYVNQGKMRLHVAPLLKICFDRINQGDIQLEKEEVFAQLFPDQAYKEGKIEKTMVEANKLIRSFLISKKYLGPENEFRQQLDFAEVLQARKLEDRFKLALARLQKIQEEAPWKNLDYYFRQFQLEDMIHESESMHNKVKGDLNISNLLESLEYYFYIYRIQNLNIFLLQQKAANLEIPEVIQNILDNEPVVPAKYIDGNPTLEIHHTIYQLLRKSRQELVDIEFLSQRLKNYELLLDPKMHKAFHAYLRNFGVLLANEHNDNTEIRAMLFKLYREGLEREYIQHEGSLAPNTILAITHVALRLKEFDWIENFLKVYQNRILHDNETRDYYRLNRALFLFGIHKYDECLDCLPPNFASVEYLLMGKRLEIKALYELKSDLLSYRIMAFKMFLSRTSNKLLPELKKTPNSDFANLLTQISFSTPGDKSRAERLIKRVKDKTQAADWHWLLEKAEELRGR